MADEAKPNLEPIDESDLNLKEKFLGGAKSDKKETDGENKPEGAKEAKYVVEGRIEKREGRAEKEEAYSKILSKISTQKQPIASVPDVSYDAKEANAEIDAESKIQNLVKLAETKGIPHAVKVARHLEDNYALDEFHDRLLGEELHMALIKKGMIKEI